MSIFVNLLIIIQLSIQLRNKGYFAKNLNPIYINILQDFSKALKQK